MSNQAIMWTVIGVTAAVITTIAVVATVAIIDTFNLNENNKPVPPEGFEILNTYKLNNRYFFQGLEVIEDSPAGSGVNLLYSEGWYGSSSLGVLRLNQGNMTISQSQRKLINSKYFGEGSTYYPKDGNVYMLTWKDNVLVVFKDLYPSLNPSFTTQIPLPSVIGEGWGITHDNNYLYISNGSKNIYVCQPNAAGTGLDVIRVISANIKAQNVFFNEIEMVDGEYILANNY